MAGRSLSALTRELGRSLLRRDGAELTDGQLLGRFVEGRDEAAFEALVRRHARMVLGVCRRRLRHAQDAEDAFQVVFLVLARKAAAVRPREAVGNWLYGVACKAALKARAAVARRRERQVAEMPEPAAAADRATDELRAVLDRELSRLPDKYRSVIVLCDLEGRTRREVARQLGWPEGTVCGRLARGRQLLGRRLSRCGVALPAGAVAALAAGEVSAGVPPALMEAAVRAAGVSAAVPGHVLALARGVQRAMWLSRGKVGVLVAAGLLGIGAAGVGHGVASRAGRPGPEDGAAPLAATPAEARAAPARAPRTDAERLPGVWILVSAVGDGEALPAANGREVRLVLTERDFHSEQYGKLFGDSTYTIDPSREPRRMDLTSPGAFGDHVARGIYRLDGQRLTLCHSRAGGRRPERFASEPGSGVTLTVWTRAGP